MAKFVAISYAIETQFSTHILENVNIPKFDPENKLHLKLAELSEQCHIAARNENEEAISELEAEIDEAAAALWGITDTELKAIQNALKEMERPARRQREDNDE